MTIRRFLFVLLRRVIALGLMVLGLSACISMEPALIDAAMQNDQARVTSLLERGHDPNVVSETGFTPLYRAAQKNHLVAAKALLAAGAQVDAKWEQWTPLMAAARYEGGKEMFELLLAAGADLETRNSDDWTPLAMAARYRDADVVAALLDAGANIEAKNDYSMTPLYLAVVQDNLEVVNLLISRGADLQLTTSEGKTILGRAESASNITPAMLKAAHSANLVSRRKASLVERTAIVKERDAGLALDIRRDKYLVAYTSALKSEQYVNALLYANLLEDLNVALDDSFYYFWGEALLNVDEPQAAIDKLNRYVSVTGSSGKYYTQALKLILRAEEVRDGAAI